MRLFFIAFLLLCLSLNSIAQTSKEETFTAIDSNAFADASNHWYGIFDKTNTINARPGRPRYKASDLANIGDNILLYQKDNGGWPKNYDIQAILTEDQKDSLVKAKNQTHTSFDNGTTYTHIEALATIYHMTKVEKYKEAAIRGLKFIMTAQYKNGGFPQYYPVETGYSRHITYNDGAMVGIMQLLKDITDGKTQYLFFEKNFLQQIKASYEKGLDCIVKTQIVNDGKLTGWCQQHDEVTLEPTWARAFEPPSVSSSESAGLVLFLMSIKNPDKAVINAIQNAINWFELSKIYNTRVKTLSAPEMKTNLRMSKSDRVVVTDSTAPPIWTRYYELKTNRPLFCNRDRKVVYSLAEVDRERRDGYAWYNYGPQKVLNKYEQWQKKWAPTANVLKKSI